MIINFLNHIIYVQKLLRKMTLRFLIIALRKNKSIEKIKLEYNTEHLFDKSYIIINYRFRNAIYYKFGKHITLEKEIKIFNLTNFDKEFQLTVYGFFRKKTYQLKFEPQLKLNTDSFQTEISNLTIKLEEKIVPKLTPDFVVNNNFYKIEIKNIKLNNPKIKISNSTFNQSDFI